jgi:hypothetical protein
MIPQMMSVSSASLHAIAEQLATLNNPLRNNTDPESRRDLLRTFRLLLAEADKIIAGEIPNE